MIVRLEESRIWECEPRMKACQRCKLNFPDDVAACFLCGSALSVVEDGRIGMTIAGRYLVEAAIGEGGMATVYSARHKLVDRSCAVKIMNASLAKNEVIRERFRREAKAAQKLCLLYTSDAADEL